MTLKPMQNHWKTKVVHISVTVDAKADWQNKNTERKILRLAENVGKPCAKHGFVAVRATKGKRGRKKTGHGRKKHVGKPWDNK